MKKSVVLLVILSILSLFGGCNTNGIYKEESERKSLEGGSKATNSSQLNQGSMVNFPQQIDKTLENGIKIEAAVQISSDINMESLKTYKARVKKHDIQKAKELLLVDKEIITSEENRINENEVILITETEDGYSLSSNSGKDIMFFGPLVQEISFALTRGYLSQDRNDEKFLAKQDLSFSSREQVIQEVKGIAKELEINIDSTPVIYSFSKGQSYVTSVFSGSGAIEETKEFTQDCYLLEFQITADNMPIAKEMSGSPKNGNNTGGIILEVLYSAQGVEAFNMTGDYEIVETLSENQRGISAEEALQRLEYKYNTIILEGAYTVERINFEYIPLPEKEDEYTLIPVWRFGINHAILFPGKEDPTKTVEQNERSFVIFNALTGEEILTDVGEI